MDCDGIYIEGGKPLTGSVYIQGSKNAALPMMAAALLHEGVTVLHNCPHISDVYCMELILQHLGVKSFWRGNSLYLDASKLTGCNISSELGCRMRSSIVVMGALLGRMHKAMLPFPGGCVIGSRPIDFHLEALKCLGVFIREECGVLICEGEPTGNTCILFPRSSVGASQNAILAAVKAKGTTRIEGCAQEPEVVWLCRLLCSMGANIQGIGTKVLSIEGVTQLYDTEIHVPADRIVAGTYLCACAATRGNIIIENPPVTEMEAILTVYKKIGGQCKVNGGKLSLCSQGPLRALDYVETAIYPGFPTDLQSPLLAVLAGVEGKSHIRESIFEDRFKAVSQLRRMGAQIRVAQQHAYIDGQPFLYGSNVCANELRGGAALVIAGLGARGTTFIGNRHFIERGYAHICEDMRRLGACLEKR